MRETRSNRIAFLLLLTSLIVGVVAFCYHDAKDPPEEPVRVVYESKGGLVVFDHAAHTERMEGDCVACHHYDGDDDEKENCRDCHLDNDIPIMHAYHEKGEDFLDDDTYYSCMSCHEEGGKDPKNCRGCHK